MIRSGYCILDKLLCVQEIDEESASALGSTANELKGKKLIDFISKQSSEAQEEQEAQKVQCSFFRLSEDRVLFHVQPIDRSISEHSRLPPLVEMSTLSEMVAGIAHEINNPLAVIMGATTTLRKALHRDSIPKDIVEKQMDSIESMARRISNIVESMHKVSQSSPGDVSNDSFKEFVWAEVIKEIELLALVRLSKHKIPFEIIMDKGLDSMSVQSQGVQLSQVIVNLINNAADAVQETDGAWIKLFIELNQMDNCYYVRVKDSGTGIDENVLEKIFRPFFTTKDAESEFGSGLGLGLSISKRIAIHHGGDLHYEKGKNTCFCLKLPVRPL